MKIFKLQRPQKEYVEFELRHYKQTKKEWNDLIKQIICGSDYTITDMPRSTDVSNPTMQKAVRLVSNPRLAALERTITAIEYITGELPEEKYRLVQLKYWTYPRTLTDEGLAVELCCDRRTIYRWMDDILLGIAQELGIINVSCQFPATKLG